MKKILLVSLILLIGTIAWTQENPTPKSPTARKDKREARRERINALIKQEEEGEIIFNKQSAFGIRLATDGYGISYEIGRFKDNRKATLFFIELNEKKHNKEKKQSLQSGFNFNSLIFGKLNNFYQFKLGMGQQRIIGGKGNKNGVAVMAIYGGGITAGLLKPYYVDVAGGFRSTYPTIIDSAFAGNADYNETGASGFTVGWKDVKFKPGVHAKAALRFDYGRFNETVTAIEIGVTGEFYASKIPQMAYNKEKQFFFNGYISILLGRRK